MPTGLHRILQDAIDAVPAVRYAAGVTGIAAAVAIIASFRLGPVSAVLGVVVTLGLMAVLLAFARAADAGPEVQAAPGSAAATDKAIPRAGVVMVWVFTLLTCATGIMVFTVTFFGVPRTWQELQRSSAVVSRECSDERACSGQSPRPHPPTSSTTTTR